MSEVCLPDEQFKALQMDIADALLHAQIIDQAYYYIEDDKGNVSLTEEGQEEFNRCHDHAEFILLDNGIQNAEVMHE